MHCKWGIPYHIRSLCTVCWNMRSFMQACGLYYEQLVIIKPGREQCNLMQKCHFCSLEKVKVAHVLLCELHAPLSNLHFCTSKLHRPDCACWAMKAYMKCWPYCMEHVVLRNMLSCKLCVLQSRPAICIFVHLRTVQGAQVAVLGAELGPCYACFLSCLLFFFVIKLVSCWCFVASADTASKLVLFLYMQGHLLLLYAEPVLAEICWSCEVMLPSIAS